MTRARGPLLALAAIACDPRAGSSSLPSATTPSAAVSSGAPAGVRASDASTTPPVARAYDLDADILARTELARAQLGDAAPVAVEAGVFVLIGAGPAPFFDRAVKLAHDAVEAYFHDRFSKPPARAVTVYVFPEEGSYRAYCTRRFAGTQCDTTLGFYRPDTREVFANLGPGPTTLTHELVHPIVESDFPEAPAWFNEGLGALFEMPVFPHPGEIHGTKNWRLPGLSAALASGKTRQKARIDGLFGMPDDTFRGADQGLYYAVARYMCQWLDAKGKLWPFYHAWREGFADDPTGERSFARVVGETPAEADAAWTTWVRAL